MTSRSGSGRSLPAESPLPSGPPSCPQGWIPCPCRSRCGGSRMTATPSARPRPDSSQRCCLQCRDRSSSATPVGRCPSPDWKGGAPRRCDGTSTAAGVFEIASNRNVIIDAVVERRTHCNCLWKEGNPGFAKGTQIIALAEIA
eukprot:3649478-Rhodomonas_salina.1